MNSFGLFPIKYDPIKRKIEKIKNFEFNKTQFLLEILKKLNFLSKMQTTSNSHSFQ